MSKQYAELKMGGRLVGDPTSRTTGVTLKLVANFTIAFRPRQNDETVFIDFVTLDSDVSAYVIANYKKGDYINVLRSTPSAKTKEINGSRRQFLTWIAWQIEAKTNSVGAAPFTEENPDHDAIY